MAKQPTKKATDGEATFVNPFSPGVNYKQFTDAIPEGMSVKEYCEGHLTKDQIEWLENDLKHFKK